MKFPLYYLSSGLLREVKTKKKIQTFSSTKSDRGGLQEISNMVIRLQRKFGILENWSLRRGSRLRDVVATGGLKALKMTFQHISDHFVSCNSVRESRLGRPCIARVTSSEELGTMP